MPDEEHKDPSRGAIKRNQYPPGRTGEGSIAVTCLPGGHWRRDDMCNGGLLMERLFLRTVRPPKTSHTSPAHAASGSLSGRMAETNRAATRALCGNGSPEHDVLVRDGARPNGRGQNHHGHSLGYG